jgi:hypothetical protein
LRQEGGAELLLEAGQGRAFGYGPGYRATEAAGLLSYAEGFAEVFSERGAARVAEGAGDKVCGLR